MRLRHALSAATFALALAACGGDAATETTAAADSTIEATTVAPEADATVEATPAVFDTVTGGQIDLGALEGQDTVLWFWAPW